MSKSPTLTVMYKNFSKMKRKYGVKDDQNSNVKGIKILLIILYIFFTFSLLSYYKPKVICENDILKDENNISYSKFILFYLLLQLPLLIYLKCL
jgi:hypothetical protein